MQSIMSSFQASNIRLKRFGGAGEANSRIALMGRATSGILNTKKLEMANIGEKLWMVSHVID